MKSRFRSAALLLAMSTGLVACGGGSSSAEPPINTDYSNLRLAASTQGTLQYATDDEQVLEPLRNGLRMSLAGSPQMVTIGGPADLASSGPSGYSGTTLQVAGVDEADLVKYDGEYLYAIVQQRPQSSGAGLIRSVLKIARTHPATAGIEVTSQFIPEGEQNTTPVIYQVQSAAGNTEYLAAISQFYGGWALAQPVLSALVVHPDRTLMQLLDVRDPLNVSQTWKIELDGYLRGTRKIGDILYLVSSYRPRLAGLVLPAETTAAKETNERLILSASAAELLPRYRINGGAEQPLVKHGDCALPATLSPEDAYADLLIITAIDLKERRVTDVNCASTNVNGIYVSTDSLYVGGEGLSSDGAAITALHKFALHDGDIAYRASGTVDGRTGWMNASYFMDEHDGDLRIVTSRSDEHRLSVLRETNDRQLTLLATLPNARRPAAIGKPGERVHAVRFFGKRAYVVTARVFDPLYAIDLSDPADPFIAGALEIPGVSTHLQPIGPDGAEVLLAIGRQLDAAGVGNGVKVEIFDVSDISQPRSLGVQVFGQAGSTSEATDDPHALALLPLEGLHSYRLALPINVFDKPDLISTRWLYSGMHLLQIDGLGTGTPRLSLAGVIKTAEPDTFHRYPPYPTPNRAVLHGDSVFVASGDDFTGSSWSQLRSDTHTQSME